MRYRAYWWISVALVTAALLLASGCARKRRAPLPPPAPGPPARPAETAPPATKTAPEEPKLPAGSLAYPQGCKPVDVAPWRQCEHLSETGERLTYYLYLPAAEPDTPLPVVTVLHGSSGSGPGDGRALDGAHRYATQLWVSHPVQARHPSIVVVPQANPAPGETWVRAWRAPAPGDARPKEALVLVMEVLAGLRHRYPVDERRLYLTGQSMGGFGAWLAYTRYPGVFAGIVPVCGGGDPAAVVPNATAVWAFHGDQDNVVAVQRAREMIGAIEAAGGVVRYTEYPGRGHNIFSEAYNEPELVDWLFAQMLTASPEP